MARKFLFSGPGGRNVSYRDSRIAAQTTALGTLSTNVSSAGTMSAQPQHRTIVTAVGNAGGVRTVPAVNSSSVNTGAFKIHSQHHRVITSTQHAQVSVVQRSQSAATIQKPSFMELQTRKVIVPATANSKLRYCLFCVRLKNNLQV